MTNTRCWPHRMDHMHERSKGFKRNMAWAQMKLGKQLIVGREQAWAGVNLLAWPRSKLLSLMALYLRIMRTSSILSTVSPVVTNLSALVYGVVPTRATSRPDGT